MGGGYRQDGEDRAVRLRIVGSAARHAGVDLQVSMHACKQ